jgi:hypothetical protein
VRLYNAGGTVLASAKVTTSDPQEGSPISFYSHAITPVLLAANTAYFIAEDIASVSTLAYIAATGLTTNPPITYHGGVSALGQGQNPTTDALGGINPAYFGPNFDATLAAVPEPASLTLLAMGLAGLGMVLRTRRS